MKWYPISDSELRFLAVADGASALLFSFGSACVVFALDLTKDFAMASDVPVAAATTWGGYKVAAWILGFVSGMSGAAVVVWRGMTVKKLKDATDFN